MASIASDIETAPRAQPAWLGDAPVLLAIVATAFIARLPWFGFPLAGYDEQLYSLIGQAMTQGALPFVDVWDRKPIGLFALFAAAHAVGGAEPEAYQSLALRAFWQPAHRSSSPPTRRLLRRTMRRRRWCSDTSIAIIANSPKSRSETARPARANAAAELSSAGVRPPSIGPPLAPPASYGS